MSASDRQAWRRLAACAAAAALLQLDGTIVTVALPSLGRALHVSGSATSTVLATYFVAFAVLLLPGGILADRLGSRRVALIGLGVFAIGALAGALAPGFGLLLGARVVQGAGAGLVSPAALAGAVSGFGPERRGAALGAWGASAGVANLVGPLLGGGLTVAFGWRAVWWVLLPLAIAAAAGIRGCLPRATRAPSSAPSTGPLNSIVAIAAVIAGLTFAVMIGCFFVAEQFLQRRAGESALGAGAVLMLVALVAGAVSSPAGRLADQRGERPPMVVGFLIAAAGLGVLGIPSLSLGSVWALIPALAVGGGLGLLFAPTSRVALNAVTAGAHGRASAVLSVGRLAGAGVGAGLAGLALSFGVDAARTHEALMLAALVCCIVGAPTAARLSPPVRPLASVTSE
ncbi:MAG TPA: MFS transporter [Solirubrobacteraceae bacterium]|nr:MFS transporter [Solirubrobacteraceae bacterium]